MPGASIEAITGRMGIGAIAFLGCFLFVDGLQLGVFEIIEANAKSASWGLVGVVPTLVITYVVGMFCLGVAEVAFARAPSLAGPSPADVIVVSRAESELLQQIYAEHLRSRELLLGSSVALPILALGAIAESSNSSVLIGVLAAAAALSLSALALIFARRSVKAASEVVIAATTPLR